MKYEIKKVKKDNTMFYVMWALVAVYFIIACRAIIH